MQAAVVTPFPEARSFAFGEIGALLERGVRDGVFPGAVCLIGRDGEILHRTAKGLRGAKGRGLDTGPMAVDTVFDVASLTSIVVTTTIFMKLVEEGRVELDHKVSRYIQGFNVMGKGAVTIGHLLSHTSGLAPWIPFFEEILAENAGARMGILTSKGAKDYVLNTITRTTLKYEPGTRQVYSDLGFLLLGYLIEILTGLSLAKAAQRYLFQPLGMKSTSYIDLSMIKRRGIHPVTDLIAPTEECAWRKRVLCGEVHDDNAWAMGGIAGHSGLFSTALDLHLYAREIIASYRGGSALLRSGTVRKFWEELNIPQSIGWKLGWDTPSKENGLIDSHLSENAVGCCGFTGCSLWIEPELGVDIVLMTNRINPTRANKKIIPFRVELHDAVLAALTKI